MTRAQVQLFVLVGLLFFLGALVLPALAQMREAEGRLQSVNNLKQLGISMHNFYSAHKRMPLMGGKHPVAQGSTFFHLLPYIEQDFLYRMAEKDSWAIADSVIPVLTDPRDTSAADYPYQKLIATTSYAGNWQVFNGKYTLLVPDGTSNTLAFVNRFQVCSGTPNAWAYSRLYTWSPMFGYYSTAMFQTNPRQADCDPYVGQAIGPIMLASLCDGSARSVAPSVSPLTWYCATDPADGLSLGNDW